MNLAHPRIYRYLFSHIQDDEPDEKIKKVAEELVFMLVKDLRLSKRDAKQFQQPNPDVTILSFYADEENKTYLLQFLCHDIMTTIIEFNQIDFREDPLQFWKRKHRPLFPDTPDCLGQTTALLAQAEPDPAIIREIGVVCFGMNVHESLPSSQFDWGMLYALPESDRYVLLVPNDENWETGDKFFSFSFTMLEAIRHKLVYETTQYRIFKRQNREYENHINELMDKIYQEVGSKQQKNSSFEKNLRNVDETQTKLYKNLAETEALLLTLNINSENLTNYLNALPFLGTDTIFSPLINEFKILARQIQIDLKYIHILSKSMDKREELLRLKIDWKRKAAEERNNKIREITNALIFAFGVAIGVWEFLTKLNLPILTDVTLRIAAIVIGACVAYMLRRWLGKEKIEGSLKEISDGKNILDNIEK